MNNKVTERLIESLDSFTTAYENAVSAITYTISVVGDIDIKDNNVIVGNMIIKRIYDYDYEHNNSPRIDYINKTDNKTYNDIAINSLLGDELYLLIDRINVLLNEKHKR